MQAQGVLKCGIIKSNAERKAGERILNSEQSDRANAAFVLLWSPYGDANRDS